MKKDKTDKKDAGALKAKRNSTTLAGTDAREYTSWLAELKLRYRSQQLKAAVQVNQAMLVFYWNLGKDIADHQFANTYGSGFFQKLSSDLRHELPDAKGFSPQNLWYIKRFYDLYSPVFLNIQLPTSDLQNFPQPEGKLPGGVGEPDGRYLFMVPWGHHKLIMDKCFSAPEKALFYIRKIAEYNWSRSVLMNFLDTGLYEREGKAVTNFRASLPLPQGELAQEITRDPYNFNFLTLDTKYREKELKRALIANITKFLLELGSGFAYMGREYRLNVGETEQFLDLLFYNINLRCYVVIEVKTGEFAPADLGQLGTYVVAVNHTLKKPDENPTLGLLICKSKDNVLAQYALESSNVPIGVSEYELAKLYPADFKSSLPSIELLERELNKESSDE